MPITPPPSLYNLINSLSLIERNIKIFNTNNTGKLFFSIYKISCTCKKKQKTKTNSQDKQKCKLEFSDVKTLLQNG